ncbi:MAG: Crp/Fnr family transcriptional regulator [Candidatus Cyclobacteriaceae bacterium M2_1C_046]
MDDLLKNIYENILEPELIREIEENGKIKKVEKNEILITYNKYIKMIPLVIEGSIKVIREDYEGNEIFLYHLIGGDTCAMSLTCCMQDKQSQIKAIAETNAIVCNIPVRFMDEWFKYSSWKKYILQSYSNRFDEMLRAIDTLAFKKMDERLMEYLLDIKQSTGDFNIYKTHQEIARELNTSRVVVSRLLKMLETEDKIEMHRNRIEIL